MELETTPRQLAMTVGTSVVEVSPEPGTRKRNTLVLTNVSTTNQIIYLAWGEDAAANKGIPLWPGGIWCESIDVAYKPSNLRITALASAAGGTLAIFERTD